MFSESKKGTFYPLICEFHDSFEHEGNLIFVFERLDRDLESLLIGKNNEPNEPLYFLDNAERQWVCLLQLTCELIALVLHTFLSLSQCIHLVLGLIQLCTVTLDL